MFRGRERFPDMVKQRFRILRILMMLIVAAQSSTIRRSPKEDSPRDSKWAPPSVDFGVPDLGINRFDEDYSTGNERGEPESFQPDERPHPGHEEHPDPDYEDGDGAPGNVDDDYVVERDEGGIHGPIGSEDDLEEPEDDKEDPEVPFPRGEEVPKEVGDPHTDEEENKTGEGVEGGMKTPVFGGGGFFGGRGKGPGFFGVGPIFDSPFFNLNQIRKYFHQMERALENVFRQTVEEARLLNGTYANTTEEEVDINGKKYKVMKSVLKGRDNNTSIYIETLSSKPKPKEEEVGEETNSKV